MSQLQLPSLEELQTQIQGKVAIVTGAAQGIGFATAQMLSDSGAIVVIADLHEDQGQKTAMAIGHGASFIRCDVASWSSQISLFENTISRYGRIDLLVCNAGIDPELIFSQALDDKDLAAFRGKVKYNFLADEREKDRLGSLRCPPSTIMDVNVNGVIYGIKIAIHYMRQGGGGKIAVIGSAAGYIAVPEQSIYCASKHAVLGLVRASSKRTECTENGIAIAMVAPWLTETPLTSNLDERLKTGRMSSSATDVAAAVSIIMTQPSERINGKSIWVQGQTYTEVEEIISRCHDKLIV